MEYTWTPQESSKLDSWRWSTSTSKACGRDGTVLSRNRQAANPTEVGRYEQRGSHEPQLEVQTGRERHQGQEGPRGPARPSDVVFGYASAGSAVCILTSILMSTQRSKHGRPLRLGSWDISRAQFYGTPKRNIYVKLPEEEGAGEGECGLLLKSMKGTQDAQRYGRTTTLKL